ncbi:MAG: hypothetical protein GC147_06155 [Porphyrobacter sp.]|nr:hypothetical protein [Porphyrobacter sp.]
MMQGRLGYSPQELAQSPYARFYDPAIGPLQPQVAEALLIGPQAAELLPPVGAAPSLLEPGYWPVETGYARPADGSIRVFCFTTMPGVTPTMWDWWFGWHGCEAQRYKLWHPKAHIDARWADGRADESYLGRTSLITEYLGPRVVKGAIGFVRPAVMGLDEARLVAQGEVAICARVGVPGTALKGGWLLHHLRPVDGGSEMRSRMWMGGANTAIGENPGALARGVARAIRPVAGRMLPSPADLLVHNAQEMAHLAGFLPQLFEAFGAAYRERPA